MTATGDATRIQDLGRLLAEQSRGGMPPVETSFYVVILGAVILGIGLALLLELVGARAGLRGLGLGGAILINLCGGGALLGLLTLTELPIPPRGSVILWSVAVIVLAIGICEIATRSWRYEGQ